MGSKMDNMIISTLKALACCIVIAGVMSASAQLVEPLPAGDISTMSTLGWH